MTTFRTIYDALHAVLTDYGDQAGLTPSADPFTFDYSPRSDFDSFSVDPPVTQSQGIVGGVESVIATVPIRLPREAGQYAGGAALDVADDLAHLRHGIAALDVGRAGQRAAGHDHDRAAAPERRGDRHGPDVDRVRLRGDSGASVIPLGPGTSEKRRGAVAGPRWPWLLAVLDVRCAWCDCELRACYCVDNLRGPKAGPPSDIAAYIASLPKRRRGCYGLCHASAPNSAPAMLRTAAPTAPSAAPVASARAASVRPSTTCATAAASRRSTIATHGAVGASRLAGASDARGGPNRARQCAGGVSRRWPNGRGRGGRRSGRLESSDEA